VTVAAALGSIGLNLALVPHLGINGSALATLLTYTALAFGMAAFSRRLLRLPRPPLLLWAELGGALVVIFATRSVPTHGTGAIVRLAGAGVAALAAVWILRDLQRSGAREASEAARAD